MANSAQLIHGSTGDWEIVIGLEIHAQVKSKSKLFSDAATDFGAEPNQQVTYLDAGMPGSLPVLNRECVDQAIRAGLALNAQINRFSRFDRKNYFYPDLPLGYQTSQFQFPIVGEGSITLELGDDENVKIGIERIHLEQDAGKSIHDLEPDASYIDLNRAGVALMEIVTKPDLRSSLQASECLKKMQSLLRAVGASDADMEKGQMRADVNVSVRRPGEEFGTRCEIKNVNSMRFAAQAIEFEAQRQVDILEAGGTIDQETRLFDPNVGETRSMRSKEDAHDYRYFPCPDLLPVEFSQSHVDQIRQELPELPDAKKQRFMTDYGLSNYDASILVTEKQTADYYEEVAKGRDPKLVVNWVAGELFGALNKAELSLKNSPVSSDNLGCLLDLISENVISGRIAKDVFEKMFATGDNAGDIVEKEGLRQITDDSALEKIIDELIANHPDNAAQVAEKPKMVGWFVGQVMKATQGKANPAIVNKILANKFKS